MTYVDSLISTGVDKLISLVYKRRRITVEEAADNLGISPRVIEEWSKILEEQGLVKIEFSFTKAYLVWIGSDVKEPEKLADLRKTRDSLVDEVEGLRRKIKTMLEDSKKASKGIKPIIKDITTAQKGISKAVETLEAIEKEAENSYRKGLDLLAELEDINNKMEDRIAKIENIMKMEESKINEDIKMIDEITTQYAQMKEQMAEYITQLNDLKELVESKIVQLEEKYDEIAARLDQYSQLKTENLQKDLEVAKKEFERVSEIYSEIYEDMLKRMDQIQKALETIEEFASQIDDLEAKVGEDVVAQRLQEIKNLSENMEVLIDEEERLDKKLALLMKELDSLDISVKPQQDAELEGRIETSKRKIQNAKKEVTLIEQKRMELMNLMERMRKKEGKK